MIIKFGSLAPNRALAKFKFGGSTHLAAYYVIINIVEGALPSSRLRYLNKALSLQIYKKYNWQRVSDELAICTACEKQHWAGPSALQHVLRLTHCGHSQNNISGF